MECTNYHILITGYIDHELSDEEMHQLKTHLQVCTDCMAHLQKTEQVQTMLKRYQLVQDIPKASPNFARNITRVLQETTSLEPRPAFLVRAMSRYHAFVLRFVERWITSLRARPVAWVTSVSCALILMAGVVFLDMTHTLDQPPRYALMQPDPNPITGDRQQPVTTINAPEDWQLTPAAVPIPEALADGDALNLDSSGLPDFIKFSDEPVVQIAKTNAPVGSYVYAHIVEASQEQFLDNAVFAGYVQDALFQ